jgi:hypothetical protein
MWMRIGGCVLVGFLTTGQTFTTDADRRLHGPVEMIASPMNSAYMPRCIIRDASYIGAREVVYGGPKPLFYSGPCTWEDFKRYEERLARAVRERLGDRGRR